MAAKRPIGAWAGEGQPLLTTAGAARRAIYLPAFRSQIDALGVETTLLIDTYDIREGVATAIRVAGTGLGGVRIDSGDLPTVSAAPSKARSG